MEEHPAEKRHPFHEKHSSKDRSHSRKLSSSKHHKFCSNTSADAGSSSASPKKSSFVNAGNDASQEPRRTKHRSSTASHKHEKKIDKSGKHEEKKTTRVREIDFLCRSGRYDSERKQAGSFGDALGSSDSLSKKRSKSAPSFRASSAPSFITKTPNKRVLDEGKALKAERAGNNKRTKAYCGARGAGLLQVPTLMDVCLGSLIQNIGHLEYTGGVPYEILRPVLEKCSANQLRNIEYYNPYLMEDTDAMWQALVKKEFKCERREEMETWREMHARCSEEREQKYNKLRSMIEGKRKESLASSRKTKVAYEHTVALTKPRLWLCDQALWAWPRK